MTPARFCDCKTKPALALDFVRVPFARYFMWQISNRLTLQHMRGNHQCRPTFAGANIPPVLQTNIGVRDAA